MPFATGPFSVTFMETASENFLLIVPKDKNTFLPGTFSIIFSTNKSVAQKITGEEESWTTLTRMLLDPLHFTSAARLKRMSLAQVELFPVVLKGKTLHKRQVQVLFQQGGHKNFGFPREE